MFPIHDQIGRVVGFGGRKIREEDEPKYLNSAESAVFDKGTTLYALHQAAQAIRTSRRPWWSRATWMPSPATRRA